MTNHFDVLEAEKAKNPHYPWLPVSKERFDEALELMKVFELEVPDSLDAKRERHNWWGVGYREEATGQYYLHPNNMKAEELVNFVVFSETFETIKNGSILYQILQVSDAPPGMTPRQLLEMLVDKVTPGC